MALNNVATMLQKLGRLDEALGCYAKALATKEATLGAEHPSVADTLFNMGALRRKLGDFAGSALAFGNIGVPAEAGCVGMRPPQPPPRMHANGHKMFDLCACRLVAHSHACARLAHAHPALTRLRR